MITIKQDGLESAISSLSELEKAQLPFALVLALTRTAQVVAEDLRGELGVAFDRPTPATLNSLYILPATKQKLESRVWIKDGRQMGAGGRPVGREGAWGKGRAASKWLTPEIYGGPRSHKAIESMLRRKGFLKPGQYVMPGQGAELDQYGNLSSGFLAKVLSGAQLYTEEGYKANATNSAKSKAKGNGKRFFVMRDSKRGAFAVAERTEKGRAGLKIVLAVASRAPTYKPQFDFFGLAQRKAAMALPVEFSKAMIQALSTRRR